MTDMVRVALGCSEETVSTYASTVTLRGKCFATPRPLSYYYGIVSLEDKLVAEGRHGRD
jgi:hypothetical protein